jgi:hypothetical protein
MERNRIDDTRTAEHRRGHGAERVDVVRRLLPEGNKESGRAAARCGGESLDRTR